MSSFNIELDDFARLKWVSTVCNNVWTEVAIWTKLAGNVGVARIIGIFKLTWKPCTFNDCYNQIKLYLLIVEVIVLYPEYTVPNKVGIHALTPIG